MRLPLLGRVGRGAEVLRHHRQLVRGERYVVVREGGEVALQLIGRLRHGMRVRLHGHMGQRHLAVLRPERHLVHGWLVLREGGEAHRVGQVPGVVRDHVHRPVGRVDAVLRRRR